jgi:hypothetical protein
MSRYGAVALSSTSQSFSGQALVLRPSTLVIALMLAFGASLAHADGDEFFASVLRQAGGGAKNGFMGNVKDDEGRLLPDAIVTVLVKAPGEGGPTDVTYKSYTNMLGRYRTLDPVDVVGLIQGVDVELKPEDVTLVGVSKDGYTQVRRLDRSRTGQAVREIDFVMKKNRN